MSVETDIGGDDSASKEEEEDDDPGVTYTSGNKGPNREDMVNSYLPGEEEWEAKTVLDLNDPARVAVLRNFGEIFPEVEHQQPIIDEFLDQFLRARTSVGGQSRDDFKDIFMSMFGGGPRDKKGGMLAEALAENMFEED